MLTFPSLAWFQELGRLMNENEAAFRRFGYADVTWALEVQPSSPSHPAPSAALDRIFLFLSAEEDLRFHRERFATD